MSARRRLTASLMGLLLASAGCSSSEPNKSNNSNNTGAPIGGESGVSSTGGSSGTSTGTTGGTTNGGTGGNTGTGNTTSGTSGGGTNGGVSSGNGGSTGTASTGASTGSGSTGGSTGTASTGASTGGSTGVDDDAGTPPTTANFSFFVTSLAAMRKHSKSQNGFGGDLRFGETGDGAGLRGADKLCTTIAEESMPGSGAKGWAAFLSTSTVNAKDRIGAGPWYDRMGRLVAMNLTALLQTRPMGAEATIINDLPNETGLPNRAGSAEGANDDNHDTVTGSDAKGNFIPGAATCSDYTVATGTPGPMQGHSWPRSGGGGNGDAWAQAHAARGCVPGVNLVQNGGGSGDTIGAGGGYGGIYCFAKKP